jgi:membrane protease YdiL (CAAX protease family)
LFEVLLCSGFPTQLGIAALLALAGMSPFRADRTLEPRYIFILSIADAILLIGMVVIFLRLRGEEPRDVFFGKRPNLREFLIGLALIPLVFAVAIGMLVLIQALAPSLRNVPTNPLEALLGSPSDAALFAGVTVVSGGLREEVQRAFILHRFDQHLGGGIIGLLVFSVIFGAGHFIQGWDAVVTTAALGAFWGALYLVRRNLTAAMVSHSGFDVLQVGQYLLFGE